MKRIVYFFLAICLSLGYGSMGIVSAESNETAGTILDTGEFISGTYPKETVFTITISKEVGK